MATGVYVAAAGQVATGVRYDPVVRPGEASMTARRVAAQRLSFRRLAAPWGGDPGADQRLQADVAGGLDVPATPMTRYLQARTGFVDRAVVDALDRGIDQVVMVGAGYDGRSSRYAKPGVRWYELDHPDTQADKRRRLARLEIETDAVRFIAADFGRDDVSAALGAAGHDHLRQSLFACEGVAAYLPLDVLSRLLTSLRRSAASGSLLVITISLIPESESEAERRAGLSEAVGRMGEPLVSAVPRSEVAATLASSGWRIVRATDPTGLDIMTSPRSAAFVVAEPASAPGTE